MKYAIILHLYYIDLWYEFLEHLQQLDNFDLYITLPAQNKEFEHIIKEHYPDAIIFGCENKGRDILPFLHLLKTVDLSKYSAVCKLHTKKSHHRSDGDDWRQHLLYNLIGTVDIVNTHIRTFNTKRIGIIGNTSYLNVKDIGSNRTLYDKLCAHYQIIDKRVLFFEGTMFWINVKVLQYIQAQLIPEFLFVEETGHLDSQAEHAYERIFGPLSMKLKYSIHHTNFKRPKTLDVKPIAFYLPQYHSIKDTNEYFGENYTEWTALSNAKPLYKHHELKYPTKDIGYYNILEHATRKKQAYIAKKYGVHGFCYHHYWFKGKQLLETPTEMLLHDNEPDMPFCFNWHNDNIVSRLNNNMSIIQEYGTKRDWIKHIRYLIRFFKHKNYIKMHGKPMLLIYNIGHIDTFEQMFDVWEQELNIAGFPGINVIQVLGSAEGSNVDDYNYLVYGKCELHPNILTNNTPIINHNGSVATIDAEENLSKLTNIKKTSGQYYYGAFPACDTTPKQGRNGTVYINTSPSFFNKYLQVQVDKIRKNPVKEGPNFIFINAWNEWGEGCALEPSVQYDYQYLEALQSVCTKTYVPARKVKKHVNTLNDKLLADKNVALCIVDLDITRSKRAIPKPKYDVFLSTNYTQINKLSNDFNFVRQHNEEEFIKHLNSSFNFIKSKNFIKVAERFYNAKITYLLLLNYQRVHSIRFNSLVFSDDLSICNDNIIVEQVLLNKNVLYYKRGQYWFGKSETMKELFMLYDHLKYDADKTFEDIVRDYFKNTQIKISEIC